MSKKKKLYKTVIKVEILSEEPYEDGKSLDDINYDITQGHCSGVVKAASSTTLVGKKAARETIKQGSDPEFFMMDDKGNELEDE
jgi:hypothetical protein